MKLLTFMQLAETKSEISFGEIQQHMQLGENEVEEFLIDRKFEVCYFDAVFTPLEMTNNQIWLSFIKFLNKYFL